MANYYYLDDGTSTYILDTKATQIDIGGSDRDYGVTEYAGSNGGALRGFGKYSSKTISFSKRERKDSTSSTAWNSARNELITWFTKPSWTTIYFKILNGEGTRTIQTRIYPQSIGGDKFKNIAVHDEKQITFLCPSGVFEKTSATTVADTVVALTQLSTSVPNAGNIETPLKVTFTPSASATYISIQLSINYGFTLTGSFNASEAIVFDSSDSSLTINGTSVPLYVYLTSGSGLFLTAGANTVYALSDSAGSISYEIMERFI